MDGQKSCITCMTYQTTTSGPKLVLLDHVMKMQSSRQEIPPTQLLSPLDKTFFILSLNKLLGHVDLITMDELGEFDHTLPS